MRNDNRCDGIKVQEKTSSYWHTESMVFGNLKFHNWALLLALLGIARIFTAYLPNNGADQFVSSFASSPLPRPFSKKISKDSHFSRVQIVLRTKDGQQIQTQRNELFLGKTGQHRRWIAYLTMHRYSGDMSREMRERYLRVAFCSPGAFAENLGRFGSIAEVKMFIKSPNTDGIEEAEVSCAD